MKETKTGLG